LTLSTEIGYMVLRAISKISKSGFDVYGPSVSCSPLESSSHIYRISLFPKTSTNSWLYNIYEIFDS
jgi:hypothetical protein